MGDAMGSSLLPPIPAPPDDSTWVALGAYSGWRAAQVDPAGSIVLGDELMLAVTSGGRSLTEGSGSLGGLVPPGNVAVARDGGIYLLDRTAGALRRFDACECRFRTVPGFGGTGSGPRELTDARAIIVSRGNLVIADTGNQRVSVFALHGYVLRGAWMLPPAARLSADCKPVTPWTPVAVASDQRGRVYVGDPANGCVHRFGPHGEWQACISGLGAVEHLAVDCAGRLYVVITAQLGVRIFDVDGTPLGTVSRVDELAARFRPLPFQVDRDGHLAFAGCRTFDAHGEILSDRVTPDAPVYGIEGTVISESLDSKVYRCQWHRVILNGAIPLGTSVSVATYTSEIDEPLAAILDLPEDAWDTRQVAQDVRGDWDCLVRSGGGRYLWLRLAFEGSGTDTPRIGAVTIEFPRCSLRRYLPAAFGEEPAAADFTDRFLGIFDTTLRSVERQIDAQAGLFDPRSAPAQPLPGSRVDFLSWLASWVGITLDRHWSEALRRRFLRDAPRLYHVRGTRQGLWRLLLVFLGMEPRGPRPPETSRCALTCRPAPLNCAPPPPPGCSWRPPPLILEHFQLRRWLFVGAGRLGEQAVLWGSRIVNRSQLDASARADCSQLVTTQDPYRDPFHVYASKFTVFVPAAVGRSDRRRKGLENLLRAESPAHTRHYIQYVEPRFRVGVQSMIGLDAVVGRYPAGVTLGTTTLGGMTVLGEGPDGAGADGRARPSLRIGSRAQVGTTTRLE